MSDLFSFNYDLKAKYQNNNNCKNMTNLLENQNAFKDSIFGKEQQNPSEFSFTPTDLTKISYKDLSDAKTKKMINVMNLQKKAEQDSDYDTLNGLSTSELGKIEKYSAQKSTAIVDGKEVDTTDSNIRQLVSVDTNFTKSAIKTADRNNEIQENNYGQRFIDAYKAANDGKDPREVNDQYGNKFYDNFYWGEDPKKELAAMVDKAKENDKDFVDVDPKAQNKAADTTQVTPEKNNQPETVTPEKNSQPEVVTPQDKSDKKEVTPEINNQAVTEKTQQHSTSVTPEINIDQVKNNTVKFKNGQVKIFDKDGNEIKDTQTQKECLKTQIKAMNEKLKQFKTENADKLEDKSIKHNIFIQEAKIKKLQTKLEEMSK